MIQDIMPHSYDVTYKEKRAMSLDRVLLYHQGKTLMQYNDTLEERFMFPTVEEVRKFITVQDDELIYFFSIDDTNFFGLPFRKIEAFGAYYYEDNQFFRSCGIMAFAGITGYHITKWYGDNRFCGKCGCKMEHSKIERAMVCPKCKKISYPVLSPSVIVAVTDGDKLLLTKYQSTHSAYKKYALIAGYTEVGEALEATVQREVMEEVGLRVKNIRYYKSQPWSFSGALLMGFFCEADGSTECIVEQGELAEATWFCCSDIPNYEENASLTNEMIRLFKMDPDWRDKL